METVMIDIVKDKPFVPHMRKGAKAKYPWRDLQPGEAFKFTDGISMNTASSLAYTTGRGLMRKFAVRYVPGEGIWCWRIDGTEFEVVNGNYRYEAPIDHNYSERAPIATKVSVVGWQDGDTSDTPKIEWPAGADAPQMPKSTLNQRFHPKTIAQITADSEKALAEKAKSIPALDRGKLYGDDDEI